MPVGASANQFCREVVSLPAWTRMRMMCHMCTNGRMIAVYCSAARLDTQLCVQRGRMHVVIILVEQPRLQHHHSCEVSVKLWSLRCVQTRILVATSVRLTYHTLHFNLT